MIAIIGVLVRTALAGGAGRSRGGPPNAVRQFAAAKHAGRADVQRRLRRSFRRPICRALTVNGQSLQVTWFAQVNYSTNDVATDVGLLAPFIEKSKAVLKCASSNPKIEKLYNNATGGYGYNMNLGQVDFSN